MSGKKGGCWYDKFKFRPPNPPAGLPRGLPSSLISVRHRPPIHLELQVWRAAQAQSPGPSCLGLPPSFHTNHGSGWGECSRPSWDCGPPRSHVPLLRQAAVTARPGALPSDPSVPVGLFPTAFRGGVSPRSSPPLNLPSPRTPASPACLNSAIALTYPLSP